MISNALISVLTRTAVKGVQYSRLKDHSFVILESIVTALPYSERASVNFLIAKLMFDSEYNLDLEEKNHINLFGYDQFHELFVGLKLILKDVNAGSEYLSSLSLVATDSYVLDVTCNAVSDAKKLLDH